MYEIHKYFTEEANPQHGPNDPGSMALAKSPPMLGWAILYNQ